MPFPFGKSHKSPADIVKNLKESIAVLEKQDISDKKAEKFHSKMENAEVLELTVKRVQRILQSKTAESDRLQHEASERFAAGLIQCMHEVHTFVSNCPGIDASLAAELLNHLLESMPLSEGSLQDLVLDVLLDSPAAETGYGLGMHFIF